MYLRRVFGFFAFIAVLSVAAPVYAQDDAEKKPDLAAEQLDALNGKVKTLMQSLTLEEAKHFSVMYSNYTIYSMVKAVREDVKNASDACAKNNKSIADDVNSKFETWDTELATTMDEANSNINNLALAQEYAPQKDLKLIFGLVDELRAENSSRFEKTPVTTKEACEFMMSKMDETKDSLNTLLRATLISYPSLLKKTQE